MPDNIHNYVNRSMCEFASIFPTVISVLDHLLFVIGNGCDLDEESGLEELATVRKLKGE
jgi:hypothetical protein